MTRSQKRTFNQLLIFLIILVLLLTIALLVRRRMEADDTAAGSSAATSQTEQQQGSPITSLSWSNGDTFLSFSNGEDGVWRWDGDKDFPLDTTVLNSMLNALSPIKPVKSFSAGETLSSYGLENSALSLTMGYADGTELQLTFGTQAPDGTGHYMLRSDEATTVYVVSSTIPSAMDTAVYDMMALPELPAMGTITSISLRSGETELQAASGDGITWLCGGEDISESLTPLLEALSSMTLSRCENFKPSADSLAFWGMDAPSVTVQVCYDEDQLLTMQIGSQTLDGSGYYVRINDDTTIYSISAYSLEPIITAAQKGFAAPAAAAQN